MRFPEITGLHIPRLQAPPVAVMGAFRTGTNYLTFLLETNFRCRVREDIYGWKHSAIPPRTIFHGHKLYLAPVVAIAKNPYSFLRSLYAYRTGVNRNMLCSDDWEQFVTGKLVVFDADKTRSPHLHFANPIAYWNWLYGNLTTLPPRKFRSVCLAYETLLAAPESEATRIASVIGLRRKPGEFRVPDKRLGRRSSVAPNDTTFSANAAAEAERRAPEMAFSAELRDFVRRWADPDVLSVFGYRLEAIAP